MIQITTAMTKDSRRPAGTDSVPEEVSQGESFQNRGVAEAAVLSDEFKQNAVRLVVQENLTFAAAAKAAGVGEQSLRRWHARLGPKSEPCGGQLSGSTVFSPYSIPTLLRYPCRTRLAESPSNFRPRPAHAASPIAKLQKPVDHRMPHRNYREAGCIAR